MQDLGSRLVNLAIGSPGVKYKQSAMPFVQMENISHFLRACQAPPLNLQQHDMFLTVDLYEQKDPAQVLQCLGAFSRAANSVKPSVFPAAIGPRARGNVLSPQSTGSTTPTGSRSRGMSNASNASPSLYGRTPTLVSVQTGDSNGGRWSPTKSPSHNGPGSPANVSTWSRKEHEGATSPAWNIAQYGYMGGASQGNLGISFGGRRQITSAGPYVPNMADRERRKKEEEAEAERQRQQMQEEERRAKLEEERRWEEETRRLRLEEQRKAEEEKRRWEEEEREWRITEEKRRKEEAEAEARLQQERQRARSRSDARLQGQFLSQYQAEQDATRTDDYSSRVKQLEQELELARQREAEYQRGREDRSRRQGSSEEDQKSRARSRSRPARPQSRQESWSVSDEREFLSKQRGDHQPDQAPGPEGSVPPVRSARPLPDPATAAAPPPTKVKTHRTGGDGPPAAPVRKQHTGSRPLPDPSDYASPPPKHAEPAGGSRTDRYLASHPAPQQPPPQQTYSRELGATAERDGEDRRRAAAQQATKAGGRASKSLLEREMEMERQRQREWEEAQKETAKAARNGDGVEGIGGGVGGRWDVGQWAGYTGGDNQNKGGQGIGAGRRQIVGPRPLPGSR